MLEAARSALRNATRPVTFSGAGLSAESGVPTFREAQTGLWARYDPMTLASPEGFAADPGLVVGWYNERRRKLASARPNAAHQALAERSDMVHITQNVDDLLERAGANNIVHLHGSLDRDKCSGGCGHREAVNLADPRPLRPCPRCGHWMRPDVVWFGEQLPRVAWLRADELAAGTDAFIVKPVFIASNALCAGVPSLRLITRAVSITSVSREKPMSMSSAATLASVSGIPSNPMIPAVMIMSAAAPKITAKLGASARKTRKIMIAENKNE